jgi:small subunit ribosomal protein S12e
MTVPDSKQLGDWAGLCKLDKDANPRKVVPCSCVVVKEFGRQSEELKYLLDHLKSQ